MKKLLLSSFVALLTTLQVIASDNLLISGQITSITNGVTTPVDGQTVTFSYTGNSGTETWSATTGINGFYEISLVGMSVTGPNRLVIVSTAGCNGMPLSDTVSNNQGTVDQAVVNFVTCETVSNNCEAFFSYSIAATNDQIVVFENESFGAALSSIWSINGVNFSDNESPEHLFAPGTYEVCLHVVSGTMDPIGCEDTYCTTVTIPEDSTSCTTDFAYGQNGASFVFEPNINTQVGYTFNWSFGDGSNSDAYHPNHTFEPGSYEVCLSMTNPAGCNSNHCELIVVEGAADPCQAIFEATVSNANPLRMIYFNNSLTPFNGITSYSWTFGDGSSATSLNAEHTYDAAGYYTVCLIMQNDLCSDTICQEVLVPGQAPEGFLVAGSIIINGMGADDAKVKLYTVDPTSGVSELFAQTEVDSLGRYAFLNVPAGAYYIKANLTQFSSYFGQFAPTYFGNVLYWENATLVEVASNQDNYNIAMLAAENNGGPGTVGGNVDEGPGRLMNPELFSSATGPAANVHVLVTNLAGDAQRWTNSDANGNFSINNLDYGDYLLFADVAGIVSIPMAFTISPETPNATVMFVLGDVVTSITSSASENLAIYPNPASNLIQINVKNGDAQKFSLISATGSLVLQQNVVGTQNQLDLSSVAAGSYFLVVENAQGIRTSAKLLNVIK
jgi:PKD repeat protein